MRVAVVGAGVIGCSVAERLQRGGHQVTVYERDTVGAHASGAAAGLLAPFSEDERDAGARSLRLFPGLAQRLLEETGIDVQFHDMDSLTPAFDPEDETVLRRWPRRPAARAPRSASIRPSPRPKTSKTPTWWCWPQDPGRPTWPPPSAWRCRSGPAAASWSGSGRHRPDGRL